MELLDRLIKFTTIRPRSEFEIKRWLVRKKISGEDCKVALQELKKAGLVDDEAFARWWIEQRTTFRPKSLRMLILELVKKGVDKDLAQKVVSESGLNDEELVFQLIEKRKRVWEKLDKETRKKKIVNFLSSRGFSWGVIRKVINSRLTSFS